MRDDSPQALTTTVRESESHPRLSVIVPAYNGGTALTECLDALRASVGPEHEVLLVDDASTDDTAARAEARGLRVIRLARNGGPAARATKGLGRRAGRSYSSSMRTSCSPRERFDGSRGLFLQPAWWRRFLGPTTRLRRLQGWSRNIETCSIILSIKTAIRMRRPFGPAAARFAEESSQRVGGFDEQKFSAPVDRRHRAWLSAQGVRVSHSY